MCEGGWRGGGSHLLVLPGTLHISIEIWIMLIPPMRKVGLGDFVALHISIICSIVYIYMIYTHILMHYCYFTYLLYCINMYIYIFLLEIRIMLILPLVKEGKCITYLYSIWILGTC